MPDPPVAIELLNELDRNGVLRRADSTVEFIHESIRDYFAAVKMMDWPLAEAIGNAPRLIWRHITPAFNEYQVDSGMTLPFTMITGLRSDPGTFVVALAERNLVLAAECYAEAPTAGAGKYLTNILHALLRHWQPSRRWIACQCIGRARLRGRELIGSLLELVHSDTEIYVQDAAALALGRIGDRQAIRQLVLEALAEEATTEWRGSSAWHCRYSVET
jgi:hypothetical protein